MDRQKKLSNIGGREEEREVEEGADEWINGKRQRGYTVCESYWGHTPEQLVHNVSINVNLIQCCQCRVAGCLMCQHVSHWSCWIFCLPKALSMRQRYLSMFRDVQLMEVKPGCMASSTCQGSSIWWCTLYSSWCASQSHFVIDSHVTS